MYLISSELPWEFSHKKILIIFIMVYKIRNKSFFWTRAGWKNHWHPKNFNAPRPSSSEFTIAIRCRYDHNSFLRCI